MLSRLGRDQEAATLHGAYAARGFASENENEVRWRAITEWAYIIAGKGDLNHLRALAEENPASSGAFEFLARALAHYSDQKGAGETFVTAAALAAIPSEKLPLMGRAAVAYERGGLAAEAGQVLDRMREIASAGSLPEHKLVLAALRDCASIAEDQTASRAIAERLVELNPSDSSLRWKLAFEHSEGDAGDLALLHYSRIPVEERSSAAWNNLGVQI